MDFEARIEKPTERHEALAHSVELLNANERQNRIAKRFALLVESVRDWVGAVCTHEACLGRLEGQQVPA